jgi:tetratricopeptide (TPR) repeat protein
VLVLLGYQSWSLGYAYENEETLYRDIISKNPRSILAYNNLGFVLFNKGKFKESTKCYKESLGVEPKQPDVMTSLGIALFGSENFEEAFTYHRKALRLDPQSVRANCEFGTELAKVGRYKEALTYLNRAYRLNPQSINVLNNLGWVFATAADPSIRNGALAVSMAERACFLTKYSSPGLLDTLAAAHAETGSFDTATQFAERAKKIAIITNQTVLVKELGSRIHLYRSSRPFREKPKIAVKVGSLSKSVD